jgi:hypothetical protein
MFRGVGSLRLARQWAPAAVRTCRDQALPTFSQARKSGAGVSTRFAEILASQAAQV